MKRILLLTTLLGIMLGAVAQNTQTRAEVTLTLTLHPYLHIEAIQKEVHLEYKTISNYRNGVSKVMPNHLLIHSSTSFLVSVQVMHNEIGEGKINVLAERASGTGGWGATYNSIDLVNSSQNFISALRGHDLRYNVTYKGKSGFGYENITTQNLDKYTGIVRYTIIPQ